jgi:SprT-like family
MIDSLFKKGETHHEIGGIHCRDAFDCLCAVLFHEMVHLVMFMTDLKTGHGAQFQALARHLFGQLKYTHNFPRHKEYKGYALNDSFVYAGHKYTIIKFNPERVKARREDGKTWNFPYASLPQRPESESDDDDVIIIESSKSKSKSKSKKSKSKSRSKSKSKSPKPVVLLKKQVGDMVMLQGKSYKILQFKRTRALVERGDGKRLLVDINNL